MRQIGLWQVRTDGPAKLRPSGVELEAYLEDWIERDPSLLQQGLVIVGRQVAVEGGRLDLLGLDPQGRWAVIEIKSGQIRRETIAQALDYASCIAAMEREALYAKVADYLQRRGSSLDALFEEYGGQADDPGELRDVVMYVVGTGRAPGLERMIDYLSRAHGVPVVLVSYEVFETAEGQRILVRELTDVEAKGAAVESPRPELEDLRAKAKRAGFGESFDLLLEAARRHNLYPRPYKWSLMVTPSENRARMLFTATVRPKSDGLLRVYVWPEAFAQFYSVAEEEAASLLGRAGWQKMTVEDVKAFVANLDRLLGSVAVENG
ncbi:MAG: DUF91 domain-containing protein [Anaerolineae bacterium]|nr:DUF91 domain-containing protein [Anaerolineae bacterium]